MHEFPMVPVVHPRLFLASTSPECAQHRVRMNMYIAQAIGGRFKVVKDLGMIAPKEPMVSSQQAAE